MKVAIIADALDNQNAGVHVYLKLFIEALVKNAPTWEITLIRLRPANDFPQCKHIIIPNPFKNPFGYASWRLFFLVPAELKRLKPDVVIEPAHFGPFNLPKSIRRVTIIHDLTPLLFPQFHRFHSQLLQRIFLPGILKKASLIITNSQNTEKDVNRYFPFTRGKTMYSYPYLQKQFLSRKQEVNSAVCKEPYFLYTGTWEPRKDISCILKAFTVYKDAGGKAELVLAGGMGWKVEFLIKEIESHPYKNSIHIPGFVEDAYLPILMRNAIGFIYVSKYEGFGLPVLEAMSCHCPVITTNVSSLPEVAGSAGLYIEVGDFAQLANYMTLLDNPLYQQEYGELSLARSMVFTEERFILPVITILNKL